MFVVLGVMLAGILAGYLLRRRNLRRLGNIISALIWLLLFLLGVEAGSDERIVRGFASLGWEAFAISVASVAGSAFLSLLLWKFLRSRRKEDVNGTTGNFKGKEAKK